MSESKNGENKEQRTARALAEFAKPKAFTYKGHPDVTDIAALSAENPTKEQQEVINEYLPIKKGGKGMAACYCCGRTHTVTDPKLVAKITFYEIAATKAIVAISDSCREKYFQSFAATTLTNPSVYLAVHPTVAKGK